jgi:hypothetical protein
MRLRTLTLYRILYLIQIFLEMELRGLVPNLYIHSSVSDLYIPMIGPPNCCIAFADRSWEHINRSQIHECGNWEWARPCSFISGNICFEYSLQCEGYEPHILYRMQQLLLCSIFVCWGGIFSTVHLQCSKCTVLLRPLASEFKTHWSFGVSSTLYMFFGAVQPRAVWAQKIRAGTSRNALKRLSGRNRSSCVHRKGFEYLEGGGGGDDRFID